MNKKAISKTLIILIVVIAFIIGITLSYFIFYSKNTTPTEDSIPKSINDCNKINQQTERDICYKDVAIYQKDFSICDMMTQAALLYSGVGTNCYRGVAKERKNINECSDISNQNLKEYCYFGVAEGKSDYTICDNIDYSINKQNCYMVIAVNLKDRTICDRIEHDSIKQQCYMNL
ncbi:MAG: hypothetical protein V1889_01515 [archaeon]